MSAILRKRPPSSGGGSIEQSSSKKQRFIDFTKMLLDIAKESSDAFPPLKSCLGGISALIKHYEEYTDVKDKLGDLIPWVEKLMATLEKVDPSGDSDEIKRRSELASSLDDIGKRSTSLSEKGKVARALDKSRDSGKVVRLVEELRQAILVYQLSQQQSIYNQVVQLTGSFDVLLKLHQASPVKSKIDHILARLDRLGVEGSAPGNDDENKRRKNLFEAFERIKDKLQLLSDSGAKKEGDMATVCDLADDLRDAIVEYQFAQQNAMYEQNRKLIDAAELSVLNSCRRASGADFRHGDRRGCLKGTRTTILDEIQLWSNNPDTAPVYWLNGLAGTGKTTIAQTIAEHFFTEGRLGASFFCSRDFNDRRNLHYIFPTLAFQLAHKYAKFRSVLVPLLQSNPDVAHESLFNQMRMLLAEPLSSSVTSTVIIIDALDECVDDDPQSAILSVMGRLVEEVPNTKFFITGRPEPRIQSGFRLGLLRPLTDVFVLHEVEPSVVNTDIRLFLKHGLLEIAKRRSIEQGGWPTDKHLDLLSERAAGLFVYAVATLKFLDHGFASPSRQLDIILKAPGSTAYEGKARFQQSATLDSLYLSCFQSAFDGMSLEDDEIVRSVVAIVVLAIDPLPPSAIAILTNLGDKEVMDLLGLIQSLLKLPEDPNSPVLPFHKSFPDFITDPLRCLNERFHISPNISHLKISLSCLELMNISLQQNLLSLPDYALNSDVQDMKIRVDSQINCAVQYACKFWHSHLTEVKGDASAIIPALQSFLEERFLAWLEVLSVTGFAKGAAVALEALMHWLQKVVKDHQLLDTTRDYLQFATNFSEIIHTSATHIYHSALELSPLSSIVQRHYYSQRPHPSPRVVMGVSDSWKPSLASTSTKDPHPLSSAWPSSAWSPCSQAVAIVSNRAVEIRDGLTLKHLSTLQLPEGATRFNRGIAYSPDGCFLAGSSDSALVIWDVQTGGESKKVDHGVPGNCEQLVWSLNGEKIAAFLQARKAWVVHIYEVISDTVQSFTPVQSAFYIQLWAHNQSFRMMTMTKETPRNHVVNIFEIGSTLVKIEPLTFQSHHFLGGFSPSTNRVAALVSERSYNERKLLILDTQNSKPLLQATVPASFSFSHSRFSSDGNLFAASTEGLLTIWKYTSGHYALWRKFEQIQMKVQFSPNSSSIFACIGTRLHILHLDYSPTALSKEAVNTAHSQELDAFSFFGTYIAIAYQNESIITIMDLQPQPPSTSQIIDTGLSILAMVLTGNVLLVKGSDTVVAWLLTEKGSVDGLVDNRRANQNDSLWKKPLNSYSSFLATISGEDHSSDYDPTIMFAVENEVAAVIHDGYNLCVYHTQTGEILGSDREPKSKQYCLHSPHKKDQTILYYCDSAHKHCESFEGGWPISQATLQEGWVRDPEGKCRLWVHPDWRSSEGDVNWLYNVSTLRLKNPNSPQSVIVKF